jgi:hypothetical protein
MMLAGAAVVFSALPSGATTVGGYQILVRPIYQAAGDPVYVTGTYIYGDHTGFYSNLCKTATVIVTVNYYSTSGGVKTATTNIGPADAIIATPQPVQIPADAVPTQINKQLAHVHATCQLGTKTYASSAVGVTIYGEGTHAATTTPPATTTTTAPTTTTTAARATTTTTAISVTNTAKATVSTTTAPHEAEAAQATTATTTPSNLAETGADIGLEFALGGSLIVAGSLLLAYDYRRRRRLR